MKVYHGTAEFYKKDWTEIYELLKKELNKPL